MARYAVHQLRGGFALDCQADELAHMPTRFVVPIEPFNRALFVSDRLNPQFQIGGRKMLMVTQLAGTIRTRELGDVIAALMRDEHHLAIQGAFDMLMTGV